MCAGSDAEIGPDRVSLSMGHNGGSLEVGGTLYSGGSPDGIKYQLKGYTKNELIDLMVDLIDNCYE